MTFYLFVHAFYATSSSTRLNLLTQINISFLVEHFPALCSAGRFVSHDLLHSFHNLFCDPKLAKICLRSCEFEAQQCKGNFNPQLFFFPFLSFFLLHLPVAIMSCHRLTGWLRLVTEEVMTNVVMKVQWFILSKCTCARVCVFVGGRAGGWVGGRGICQKLVQWILKLGVFGYRMSVMKMNSK